MVVESEVQFRKISVPPHRYALLKRELDIYYPICDQMKIDVKMNLKSRNVELRTRKDTPDVGNLQKSADFVHAFMLGFDSFDALLILGDDEVYVDSFEIKDVTTPKGEHLSRAMRRLSDEGGKITSAIEDATNTEIVIADSRVHILGSCESIKVARHSLCSIMVNPNPAYSRL